MAHILIVDDEREFSSLLATLLRERQHTAECAGSGETALAAVCAHAPDLVLLDLQMDGMGGLETLRRLKRRCPALPVVIMTAYGDVSSAVTAMKAGAIDFVSKPFNNRALLDSVDKLLAMHNHGAPGEVDHALVGASRAFRAPLDLALKFAVSDINILLLGETGTGKELFARMIHDASKRRNGPFVAVDCSTLVENLVESELFGHERGAFTGATVARNGHLEAAQGGTLFLDEIGNLSVAVQAKLLRVLQERCVARVGGRESIRLDVRILSATNTNLKDSICDGTFRQDLFYRLGEMSIHLPALRERDGDVRRIAQHFVQRYAERFGRRARELSNDALELLHRYPWPGNVRELESAIKSAVVLADDVVRAEHLPPEIRSSDAPGAEVVAGLDLEHAAASLLDRGLRSAEIDLKAFGAEAAEQAERLLLGALVRRPHMSGARMARMLSVDPKTLRVKLRKYGLGQS